MGKFIFYMKRNFFPIDSFELYHTGIIQGLIYGMCAIPCKSTLWDCERFERFVMFPVDSTDELCEKCMELINLKYPGLCHYEKIEES